MAVRKLFFCRKGTLAIPRIYIKLRFPTWGVENSKAGTSKVAARSHILIAGPELLGLHLPGEADV